MCDYTKDSFFEQGSLDYCDDVEDLAYAVAREEGREEPTRQDYDDAIDSVHPYIDEEGL